MNKDLEELSMLEQSLHHAGSQRQTFNAQLVEAESAVSEMNDDGVAYKIIGNIMVKKEKAELKKDLDERIALLKARISAVEKQEESLKKKFKDLQGNIFKDLEKEKKEDK